ncbi:MAG: phosphotransferase [Victivallaceae bacterium]|nr:phosphotransferase [Victivallaceae bacterium]
MGINAIVLAAGFGTRLRPLTDLMPKPLVPVCNIPLLENVLLNLTAAGIDKVAVNTHHLAEQMNDFVAESVFSQQVELFHEPEILGTGGPLINARELLKQTPFFLLHNSDILTDMDLRQLCETHQQSGNKVTMALIDGPENKVCLTSDGRIHDILGRLGRAPAESQKLTYSGMMVLSPEIFNWLPQEPCNCSIITAVLKLMEVEPEAVGAFLPGEIYWNDLGTLPKYFQVHQDIFAGEVKLEHFEFAVNRCCAESAVIAVDSKINGFLVAGKNSVIGSQANVANTILLAGAVVNSGQYCCNEIITQNGTIHRDFKELSQLDILKTELAGGAEISSLPEAGSARRFYRIFTPQRSAVLVISDEADADFEHFVDYGRFMNGIEFPTPDIYKTCSDEYTILVEDLGNVTLYGKVKNSDSDDEIKTLYRLVIDRLVDFQWNGTKHFQRSDAPSVREFDYAYLRWESDYFLSKLIGKYLGVKLIGGEREAMNSAFDRLAELADRHPKYLMHRDFQSQNIMVTDNGIRFVDYQGMRLGPPGYDIAALLNDPYVELDTTLRHELFDYYIARAGEHIAGDFEAYIAAAWLQRSMQTLGAFAFLGLVKGKRQYLEHIPRGMELLVEGLDRFEHKFFFTIPGLHSLLK